MYFYKYLRWQMKVMPFGFYFLMSFQFQYPVCRQEVNVKRCSGKFGTFGAQFSVDSFFVSLQNAQEIWSKEKHCNAYKTDNAFSRAISWCSLCVEAFFESREMCHKSYKMTSKHQLIKFDDISRTFIEIWTFAKSIL